ncbi:TIR domain-containing protein [Pseudomonas aeruginosa]|uniref:TIR domain-containing protein n=1 Tax=Pseudomonas aeruginosa TaxID=287 RepID=UPI001A2D012D|nr:nucleotide-binding protein [Pseudomonas aeruginosa]MBG6703961.1 nucleotide-binding protein [Pseudomonas aeruginosa]MBG7218863.1 nucleotide-binding protein [Pseudomonas aeruginosa]MBG7455885.1 nucleotide-binding protein [Pseudomonas aeruginosa]MCS9378350.1 nucleotide-binding protein [Pseudomonas aeruginosa]MDP5496262.1 nucleotide-binding protein [Pseudomonas aeruginosa]
MARKTTSVTPPQPKLRLTSQEIDRGLARLSERIAELRAFDLNTVRDGNTPELKALEVAIKDSLTRCFGEDTSAYRTYAAATDLTYYPMMIGSGQRIDYHSPIQRRVRNSIALLEQAQKSLKEDLADLPASEGVETASAHEIKAVHSDRVFVVHGHDEGARESVARFLEKLGLEPIILHEQANRGRTVIEKIEGHRDVGFAVVLLTPDDQGCVKGGQLEPRARQNVLLELGYFLGYLGRDRVCALKRGQVEIPSDFAGVVWTSMNDEGWKQALSRELQDAGYEIDWNKVMRS